MELSILFDKKLKNNQIRYKHWRSSNNNNIYERRLL
ncbi:MAG: hypothetical protein Hyperionvirus8_44 [Hyperionvirus sp.]|uniref:Uncharacterized protein n=1 Tax=Hyperionvirus sp. TaxID=2487770 RepID=A0A3G5A8F8_9VIRU|nr:MAG: hypothetical protein Hyperionvirus8_44 [Hyperionvirus sp.]